MRSIKVLCISLLVSTCALPVHSSEKHWFEIRSAHFRVVTDLSAKRGVEVALRCEQMRAAFALLMNRATTHDPAPLLILALNGQAEVDEFAGESNRGKHAGLFLPGTDESFILLPKRHRRDVGIGGRGVRGVLDGVIDQVLPGKRE